MKTKKIPMRRCVGCMESKPKKELIRVVSNKEGELALDPTGKANGRGVYLCFKSDCLTKAMKKNSISRSLGREVSKADSERIFKELEEYEGKGV